MTMAAFIVAGGAMLAAMAAAFIAFLAQRRPAKAKPAGSHSFPWLG
jgi:hypothetical protein